MKEKIAEQQRIIQGNNKPRVLRWSLWRVRSSESCCWWFILRRAHVQEIAVVWDYFHHSLLLPPLPSLFIPSAILLTPSPLSPLFPLFPFSLSPSCTTSPFVLPILPFSSLIQLPFSSFSFPSPFLFPLLVSPLSHPFPHSQRKSISDNEQHDFYWRPLINNMACVYMWLDLEFPRWHNYCSMAKRSIYTEWIMHFTVSNFLTHFVQLTASMVMSYFEGFFACILLL